MADFLNPLVILANFILVPGLAYGSQLALGALGVTLIYSVLVFQFCAWRDDGLWCHVDDYDDMVVAINRR